MAPPPARETRIVPCIFRVVSRMGAGSHLVSRKCVSHRRLARAPRKTAGFRVVFFFPPFTHGMPLVAPPAMIKNNVGKLPAMRKCGHKKKSKRFVEGFCWFVVTSAGGSEKVIYSRTWICFIFAGSPKGRKTTKRTNRQAKTFRIQHTRPSFLQMQRIPEAFRRPFDTGTHSFRSVAHIS